MDGGVSGRGVYEAGGGARGDSRRQGGDWGVDPVESEYQEAGAGGALEDFVPAGEGGCVEEIAAGFAAVVVGIGDCDRMVVFLGMLGQCWLCLDDRWHGMHGLCECYIVNDPDEPVSLDSCVDVNRLTQLARSSAVTSYLSSSSMHMFVLSTKITLTYSPSTSYPKLRASNHSAKLTRELCP